LTALCFSKHVDRLSKYGIVDESSTIFFAGIDAQMKMLAGLGSFFFFGEEIDWPIIVGFLLIAASVVIMVLDKMMKQKKLEKEKQFMDLKNQLQEENHFLHQNVKRLTDLLQSEDDFKAIIEKLKQKLTSREQEMSQWRQMTQETNDKLSRQVTLLQDNLVATLSSQDKQIQDQVQLQVEQLKHQLTMNLATTSPKRRQVGDKVVTN
jgi:large-conductance mechanosensitive channel